MAERRTRRSFTREFKAQAVKRLLDGGSFFRQGGRVTTFSFVSAERANRAVAMLCRVVGASVSGFYAWLRAIAAIQSRAEAEAELRGRIGRIFAARRRV